MLGKRALIHVEVKKRLWKWAILRLALFLKMRQLAAWAATNSFVYRVEKGRWRIMEIAVEAK